MNAAVHSPGPWRIKQDGRIVCYPEALECGVLAFGLPDGEKEANARLIAAAPDLLEMAIWAEAAIAPFSKEPEEKSGISRLRAAIAKAEGR